MCRCWSRKPEEMRRWNWEQTEEHGQSYQLEDWTLWVSKNDSIIRDTFWNTVLEDIYQTEEKASKFSISWILFMNAESDFRSYLRISTFLLFYTTEIFHTIVFRNKCEAVRWNWNNWIIFYFFSQQGSHQAEELYFDPSQPEL